jgi:hypothetical protein
MRMQYIPSKDELILEIRPAKGKPNKKLNHFKLWWDEEGNISAICIGNYTEELEEFRKNLEIIHLGDTWKGVKVTEEDIKEVRETLLKGIAEKW